MRDRLPRLLLHAEGAAVAAGALVLYFDGGHPWWLLLALALAPDLSMLGYLAGPVMGARAYDAVHTYVLPGILAVAGSLTGADTAVAIGLVWLVHIGIDRAVGYGLKYRTGFQDTHLRRV